MSFLLPRSDGDSTSQEILDLEAQKGTSQADTSSKSGIRIGKQNEDTVLRALDEAAFVTPSPLPPLDQSGTLLPFPVAKLITATTGFTTFTIRTYARAFGWGLGLGRETTLKSLELSRAGIEGILKASAKDVTSRRDNHSELARADTENVLRRSISTLHWAFTAATLATSAGFTITKTYVESLEQVALQGLGTLNAVLGDTESSQAVSAIITLIKEELTRPGAEDGLVPGYWDLMLGCAGFVVLQRLGRRKTALEFRGNGGEETIWDLVIDDRGFRADVVGTRRNGGNEVTATRSLITATADEHGAENEALVLERGLGLDLPPSVTLSTQDQTSLSDEEIRDRILAQLPPGTRAVITLNTLTLKTVQVDIHGPETANIEPPPGLTMISERLDGDVGDPEQPHQTIIFRTSLKRSSSAEIDPADRLRMTPMDQDAHENGDEEPGMTMHSPKRRKSMGDGAVDAGMHYLNIGRTSQKSLAGQSNPVANQKKTRKPILQTPAVFDAKFDKRHGENIDQDTNKIEKAGIIKKALQSLSSSRPSTGSTKQQDQNSPIASRKENSLFAGLGPLSRISEADQATIKKIYPVPDGMERSPVTSPVLSPSTRSEPSMSYFTMHEKKRESTVSQTDSFSIHSAESRPGSPSSVRTRARANSNLTKTKSHVEMSLQPNSRSEKNDEGSSRHHYRSRSFVPSLYSMAGKNSDEAIILQPKMPLHRSVFEDHTMLTALANDGKVPGMFPDRHFVKSIRRFARFASASYGSNFLRMMGIVNPNGPLSTSTEMIEEEIHHEHSSFATHTGLPADTILLSGFYDPKGGPVTVSRNLPTMTPLMHFISIDHDSKAVVLTCRGTLGFEDVLTDMTCDYDDFVWQGKLYHVHKGVHASARRLLEGGGRRVMNTIQSSLEEYSDYGLILCGHSLGAAVAAVLALLISEPNKNRQASHLEPERELDSGTGASFGTATQQRLLTATSLSSSTAPINLPAGRPIHVFAYGPPASFSPTLRLATRGLITTIINHNDIVPSLSLGTLQDHKAVAIHLKQDPSSPLVRLRSSMMERVKHAMLGTFWSRESTPPRPVPSSGIPAGESDEEWQWTALTTLRNLMINDKLLPPGEVFVIETNRVFDRLDEDPESSSIPGTTPGDSAYRPLGRPATRVQFKLIRNVESRFREIRFGSGMFGDHSPGRYEGGLEALERGIFEAI